MGDLDTKAGEEGQQLLDKCAEWTERLYDMTDEQIEEYIKSQGKDCNKILYIEYSYNQIGLTEEWLAEISAKIQDPLTVRREILLQRLHGSSLSPFPQEDIEFIVEAQKKPIDELWLLDYYKFDIYKKLDKRVPYIVGVDCSTGTDGDNNAITVINPFTREPDAEFECSFIGETKYERLLIELITKIIPRGVLCIERNSIGDGIIDHLLHSPVSNRLYFDKNRDLVDETMKSNETVESMLKKQAQTKTYYGVYTSGSSREDMMAILARHVHEYKEKFVTANVTRDLSRLVRTSSGKVVAGPGFHDDSIMSYLIALYVYYHGNNLGVFGIHKEASDAELNNSGMKTPDQINPELVDNGLINGVKEQMKKEAATRRELNYNDLMKDAIQKAQTETYKMHQAGQLNDTIFDHTAEADVDDYNAGESIPMSFFTEINGGGMGMNQGNPYDTYPQVGNFKPW